jgi:hypothetical protein
VNEEADRIGPDWVSWASDSLSPIVAEIYCTVPVLLHYNTKKIAIFKERGVVRKKGMRGKR